MYVRIATLVMLLLAAILFTIAAVRDSGDVGDAIAAVALYLASGLVALRLYLWGSR